RQAHAGIQEIDPVIGRHRAALIAGFAAHPYEGPAAGGGGLAARRIARLIGGGWVCPILHFAPAAGEVLAIARNAVAARQVAVVAPVGGGEAAAGGVRGPADAALGVDRHRHILIGAGDGGGRRGRRLSRRAGERRADPDIRQALVGLHGRG